MQNEAQNTRKENVFGHEGETVEEIQATDDQPQEQAEETEQQENESQETNAPRKFRIGDQEFDTQEQALEYATSKVATLENDRLADAAYRQGVQDALSQGVNPGESVTQEAPQAPAVNVEEFYTDPQGFLSKFAKHIEEKTLNQVDKRDSLKSENDRIWREFSERHPVLAEYRKEVEAFVNEHDTEVRATMAARGKHAAYDYVATKLKSRFESYARALNPKRELPNSKNTVVPSRPSVRVTQNANEKKPLSFSEQLKSIRKGRT